MAYIGNDLQVAFPSYQIIDDISGSFNGILTEFDLEIGGTTPVPFPINPQQCLISVNGVIQEPDPTGTSGFNLNQTTKKIVFSSAPTGGHAFFGVVLAGADYVNVGVTYPDGSAAAPSISFDNDLDTGIFRVGANEVGIACGGVNVQTFSAGGVTQKFANGSEAVPSIGFFSDQDTGFYRPSANNIGVSVGGTQTALFSSTSLTLDSTAASIVFEGASFNTTLSATTATAARSISLPDAGGTLLTDATSFLRADIQATKTTGNLIFNDSVQLNFGTGSDAEFYADGSNLYLDLNSSGVTNWLIRDGTTDRFTFGRSTGDFTATGNVTAYSDRRLKEDIQVIENALDKVSKISGVTYKRTDYLIEPEGRQTGVIAQEVEEVLPEAVQTHFRSGYKAVAYGNMVGLLIEAIKELKAEVDSLKKE